MKGDMFVHSEARLQDLKNRQNSVEVEDKELETDFMLPNAYCT